MLWTIVFPNSQSNWHLTKIRVVKSQVAMLVVSSATLKFVNVFLIQTNILPLITIWIKKNKQTESCYQSRGDSSVLHWASCTANTNHVIRQVSAHIPRTRYCFSINGPCKQAQCSLALERAGDLYFSLHNFCAQILPFNLEKLRKLSKAKKKEDIAKNVHKARYLMMKIITLKKTT